MRERLAHAGFGVLAALVGVAAGHLAAALLVPASSPVLAVGSTVIDLTPTPMKEWAIREFGTKDKPILVGSVFAAVLLLAAVGGLLARRRLAVGAALLVALVALAGAAALARPAAGAVDVVPALVTAVVGVGALGWLVSAWRGGVRGAGASTGSADGREVGADGASTGSADGRQAGAGGTSTGSTASRRGVLVAVGVLGVGAAVLAGAGRWVTRYRLRPADVTLPAAADPAPAFPTGLEERVPGITPLRTPTGDFYRVDTRLDTPVVDVEDWTLTIDGDVERELTLTFDDLLAMDLVERDITLTCVSNAVGGPYVGGARWRGVLLADLLARAGVGGRADQILSTDVDGMTISTPLEPATDGRDAMVAIGMNGAALPRDHGFPARLVVPGLYGFISATKWVTRLTLTTYAEQSAYWTDREWATDAPIKIASRIDTPKSFARLDAGETFVGGVAWAQQRGGVAAVEVRVDGGPWRRAELGPDVGEDYWRQWFLPWDAEPGQHALAVRAVSGDGGTQTAVRAMPFPEGASGVQEVVVTVS